MVSGISALAIDAGSDRVDGALFLAILDFSGSKLPDKQPAQPPWRSCIGQRRTKAYHPGRRIRIGFSRAGKKLPPIVTDSNCSHHTS
jgi:hypothetical protein